MKTKNLLLVALLPLLVLAGCGKTSSEGTSTSAPASSTSVKATVYVNDFTLDSSTLTLEVGGKHTVVATLDPVKATTKGFTYTSSDAAIATVTNAGVIEGIGIGQATITVTTKGTKTDGTYVSKTIAVTVTSTAVSSLKVDFTETLLKEGETKQITATVLPANATEQGVEYATDTAAVATVSATGLITAVAEGSATITVTTKGKNAEGAVLTKTITVTVESVAAKHKVTFVNYDDSMLEAIDTIEVGTVPEFTKEVPAKPTDANGIYVFRGFDKEIVPYVASDTAIVYKAVYEKVSSQAEKVTLTSENNIPTVVITGESVGVTEADIAGKSAIEFMKRGGDWASKRASGLSATFNADKTWTMKASVEDMGIGTDANDWIGKYLFNGTDSGTDKATDLKVQYKETKNRYRHNANGNVLEDTHIADDWDGTFASDYVSAGNIKKTDGTTSSYTTEADRQAFVDAIPAPTWVGLNLDYVSNTVVYNGNDYTLLSNADNWGCVAISISAHTANTISSASIVKKDDIVYYEVKGALKTGTATAGDLAGFTYDFQHNDNVDGQGWDTPLESNDGTAKGTVAADGSWVCDIAVSTVDALKVAGKKSVYTVHFGAPGDTKGDIKVPLADDYAEIDLTDFKYSIQKDDSTWNIPALVVEAVAA
jgi:hypothetical protein